MASKLAFRDRHNGCRLTEAGVSLEKQLQRRTASDAFYKVVAPDCLWSFNDGRTITKSLTPDHTEQ